MVQLIVGAGIYGDPLSMEFASFGNGADITSALVLVNMPPEPSRPAVYFYDTEGDPIAAESLVEVTGDLEVREDGGLTLGRAIASLGELTIATHGQGDYVTGSVKVLSEAAIGGGLRFDMPDIGEAVVEASRPTGDAVFPVRRLEGSLNTGVAIHHQEYEPMDVMYRLISGRAMLEEAIIPLAANGQASWLLDGAFPGADTSDFTGSVRCTVPEGGGPTSTSTSGGRHRFTADFDIDDSRCNGSCRFLRRRQRTILHPLRSIPSHPSDVRLPDLLRKTA